MSLDDLMKLTDDGVTELSKVVWAAAEGVTFEQIAAKFREVFNPEDYLTKIPSFTRGDSIKFPIGNGNYMACVYHDSTVLFGYNHLEVLRFSGDDARRFYSELCTRVENAIELDQDDLLDLMEREYLDHDIEDDDDDLPF